MKRYLIPTVIVLMVLAVAWPTLGQREGTESRRGRGGQGRSQGLSEEERAKLKEKWQSMSEEERQKFLAERRGGFGGRGPMLGREEQLKAIEAIEGQLAKLKKAVQAGPDREAFAKLREASPEEQAKLRENMLKGRQEQQKLISAIQEQLAKLGGPGPATARPGLPVRELKAIHEMAVKENAKGTADRIEKLIASLQKAPEGRGRTREPGQKPEKSEKPREKQARKKATVEG